MIALDPVVTMPTVKELKAELDDLGVEYEPKATKAELQALLYAQASEGAASSSDDALDEDPGDVGDQHDSFGDIVEYAEGIYADDPASLRSEILERARRSGVAVPDDF